MLLPTFCLLTVCGELKIVSVPVLQSSNISDDESVTGAEEDVIFAGLWW